MKENWVANLFGSIKAELISLISGKYQNRNCKYVGDFIDGKFHGDGILYVKGGRFEGSSYKYFMYWL